MKKPSSSSFLDTSEIHGDNSQNYDLSSKKEPENSQNPDLKMSNSYDKFLINFDIF